MLRRKIILLVTLTMMMIMIFLSGCGRYQYDKFDPTTATVRWIIKKNYDVKRTSVHTKPSASPCTATDEAESNVEVWSLCPRVDVHGKHGG